ncbi:hypothetical protein ISN44_As13g004970 [Arabidopsis suecica]|uniref:Uncharacterized protein n=1 Tax=Arabidopsis suecica TaxID=45249 RepID=A0A8T1XR75_ARASU|nr:hypothetical protein ISN44_As13g004970 [Arabidopsis suecica]
MRLGILWICFEFDFVICGFGWSDFVYGICGYCETVGSGCIGSTVLL